MIRKTKPSPAISFCFSSHMQTINYYLAHKYFTVERRKYLNILTFAVIDPAVAALEVLHNGDTVTLNKLIFGEPGESDVLLENKWCTAHRYL